MDEGKMNRDLLEQILDASRRMAETRELSPLLNHVIDEATLLVGAEQGFVVLVGPDGRLGVPIERGQSGEQLQQAEDQISQSIIRQVVRSGSPLLLRDALNDPRFSIAQSVVSPKLRSIMCVPLIVGGDTLGAIYVENRSVRSRFDQDDLSPLVLFANQAAIAIENAQLFQERERRLTEMAILNEIGQALSSALDLGELLETIRQQVDRVFDTTSFYIVSYEEGSDEWEILLEIDQGQRIPPARHKLGVGLTGYIIRNRRSVLLRSLQEAIDFDRQQGQESLGDQSRSWMGVPLIVGDRLVGVMAVQSYEEENLYSEEDLALFSTIAAQAAVAVENAQLYARMRQQVWELSTPILPVRDGVLVLPLIGDVDAERARRFTERLLNAVKQTRARVVLLDITGVPMVDVAVAQALIEAAEATRLLGAEVALVGVRSEVAQTLVALSVNMQRLVTKANLQAGIEYALGLVGQQVTHKGS